MLCVLDETYFKIENYICYIFFQYHVLNLMRACEKCCRIVELILHYSVCMTSEIKLVTAIVGPAILARLCIREPHHAPPPPPFPLPPRSVDKGILFFL